MAELTREQRIAEIRRLLYLNEEIRADDVDFLLEELGAAEKEKRVYEAALRKAAEHDYQCIVDSGIAPLADEEREKTLTEQCEGWLSEARNEVERG